MKIGEALKKQRNRLGLTQDEMIQGIITKGHYSKIERGLEGISADSLFEILFAHNIDVDAFIQNYFLKIL
ncbi:helix-turn-helix domain-containing protein [Lactobacillus agrestimuris]|uniref:helix-turn-helix domain-containing protein n=1 Tax=Lactobacillus agrestimuris TaxID=2941328 RepID=UPI002043F63D|nr:helix-turn-helix transcriptional regulator [Lactobacillus agrestimuris]